MFGLVRGAIRFFSERFGGRPFVDCLICSIMVVLRFMGLFVTDGDQKKIRAAMPGDPKGGTTISMNFEALRALKCPTMPHAGTVSNDELLASLKTIGGSRRGKKAFAVTMRNSDLPRDSALRRVTGIDYTGLHAIAVVAKSSDGLFLYCMNPMGRDAANAPDPMPANWEPYVGQLEPTQNVLNAVSRKNGDIAAVWGTYNEAHGQGVTA